MALVITKVSGVLFVRDGTSTNAKSFFGATGNYQASTDNTTILITLTQPNLPIAQYTVAFADLTVGTSTPSTMSSALILLNSIFGS